MLPEFLLEVAGLATLAAAAAMAFGWGGRDERLAATAFVVATALSWSMDSQYSATQTNVLLVDFALLLGLVGLALMSDRFWPMYAAAFQLVGTIVHVASMTEKSDFAWAYAVGLIFWSYAVMATLIAGTWVEGRNRRSMRL